MADTYSPFDYIITSQENDRIAISLEVANVSELLKSMIAGDGAEIDGDSSSSSSEDEDEDELVLPNVTTVVLKLVVDFMNAHAKTPLPEITGPLQSKDLSEVVPTWAAQIVNVDPEMVFKLFDAANYMGIPPLIDLLAAKVACQIKGHSKELDFHIPKRTEEEKEIAHKNPWLSDWPLA